MSSLISHLTGLVETGGPVLLLLVATSIVSLAVFLFKVWQFNSSGLGKKGVIDQALGLWDDGQKQNARNTLSDSRHWLTSTLILGMTNPAADGMRDRLEAEAEKSLLPLEGGLKVMDVIAQLAPLLGLFGTVLGMIEAFQALQSAGNQVDPSILAGGIWVALLTTAAGLAVAMPTTIALSWLETRIDDERGFAGHAISVVLSPVADNTADLDTSGVSRNVA